MDTVKFSDISGGSLDSWSSTTSLPNQLALGGAVAAGNRIYYAGGFKIINGTTTEHSNKVYMAEINPLNGTIGTWTTLSSNLPVNLSGFGMVETGNKIVIIAGDTVYEADILPDGTLGLWVANSLAQLPRIVFRSGITKVGNFVISVGGVGGGSFFGDVYYSEIQPDGSLGSWSQSPNDFPQNWCCGSLAATDTHLYYTGGHDGSGYFNNVYVASIEDSSVNPIVFLPGYGGSYNRDALVHNASDIPDTNWRLTPFVNVYDGLIETLKNTGYLQDINLFVYPYDWRNNADETAGNLEDFIDSKVLISGNTKVDIIGHSFGGYIARAYAQNNPEKVDKLITVGTPHKGALKVYKIWEGASFSEFPFWQEILLRLHVHAHSGAFGSRVKTIQELAPSLLNIWPTFDFLKNTDGSVKPLSSLSFQNTLLPSLDDGLPDILGTLDTLSGQIENSTPRYYKVEEPSFTDTIFGKWVNGKPVSEEKDVGDETVLLSSSQVNGANNLAIQNLNHTEIISEEAGIEKILDLLAVSGNIETFPFEDFDESIVITIGSSATFEVLTPNSQILTPEDNLLIINNPQNGTYKVTVTGFEEGEYTLHFGRIKEGDEAWDTVQGSIGEGGGVEYPFEVDFAEPSLGSIPHTHADSLLIIENLKNIVSDSGAGHPNKEIMLREIMGIEETLARLEETERERLYESILNLLHIRIGHIIKRVDKTPWNSLNEVESGKIISGLNQLLNLSEESYLNKFLE